MSSRAPSGFSGQALLPPAPPAPPRPLASHGEEGEVRLRLRWGPPYPYSCPSGSAMPWGATAGDHQATQNLLRWTLTKTSAHRTPVIPESAQARLSRCHRHRAAISTAIRPPCKPVSLPACLSPPPPPPHTSPPVPQRSLWRLPHPRAPALALLYRKQPSQKTLVTRCQATKCCLHTATHL